MCALDALYSLCLREKGGRERESERERERERERESESERESRESKGILHYIHSLQGSAYLLG